jgi:hypothetical protein
VRAFVLCLAAVCFHGVAAWGYCNDADSSCANWAKSGACEDPVSGITVKRKCPHSCSICPHMCRDDDEQCPTWADNGQCTTNVDYMYKHCAASCGVCKTFCYVSVLCAARLLLSLKRSNLCGADRACILTPLLNYRTKIQHARRGRAMENAGRIRGY